MKTKEGHWLEHAGPNKRESKNLGKVLSHGDKGVALNIEAANMGRWC